MLTSQCYCLPHWIGFPGEGCRICGFLRVSFSECSEAMQFVPCDPSTEGEQMLMAHPQGCIFPDRRPRGGIVEQCSRSGSAGNLEKESSMIPSPGLIFSHEKCCLSLEKCLFQPRK